MGSRLKPAEILKATEKAIEFEAMAQRMLHGAAIAQRIAAPYEKILLQQGQLIADNAEAYLEENPGHEDELKDFLDWWTGTFPGGGTKAGNGNGTPAPGPVAADEKKGS